MNAFEPLTRAQLSRRTVLTGVGALGAGAALAPLSGVHLAAAQSETIQEILNVIVTVEMFGVTFLGVGLDSNANGNFDPPFSDAEVAIVTAARAQEQAHLEFFQSLGGEALTDTFTVPDPALLTDPTAFFNAVQEQETREVAAQIAAMVAFTELQRPDLVKVSFQYAAEEGEHRVLANYAAGARPANNLAFAPALFEQTAEIITAMEEIGLIEGSGAEATYPGPGEIDFTNVTNTSPDGSVVDCAAMTAMPNTGSGSGLMSSDGSQGLIGALGFGSLGVAAAALALRVRSRAEERTAPHGE
ncbi:MAG: hypothetical protein M3457_08305 [Chloroflexota bacterium]|nr:hypothetical protein [Chloroflexota bacterium]